MKIINRFIHSGKQIVKNKPIEIPKSKIKSEDDIVQLSSKNGKTENNKPSKFKLIKELFKSKMVNIDKNTVKELEEADFGDFLIKSQRIISDAIGIPKGLYARILPDEDMGKRAAMAYCWSTNTITINTKALDRSKCSIFCGLRHEMEHQKQAFEVFRTEDLGNDAVNYFARIRTESEIQDIETITPKEIQEIYLNYKKLYENYRQKIIKKIGVIPANSNEAQMAKKYFKCITNQDDPASIKTAIGTTCEQEAYFAGLVANIEYLVAKWLK